MLKRKVEKKIEQHFREGNDKILIVNGSRQIGKTFIVRHVSKKYFKNYVEINLKDDFEGQKLFDRVHSIDQFYKYVSSEFGESLGEKKDTIIFLDEIQVYPHLITMLKPLRTDGRFNYIASGSLLGITLRHSFVPMGSITELKMYPLDFEEFLWANNFGKESIEYLRECFKNKKSVEEVVHEITMRLFKDYLICGGFPEAVKEFVINKNVARTRRIHSEIFAFNRDDCSRYDIENKLKITKIYDLLPSYMINRVKRIIIKDIEQKSGQTFSMYENEFDYLIHSGVALQTRAISNPQFPLIESASKNLIKLYYNDVGILTNILYKENIDAILNENNKVNLGSVYETFVATELISNGHTLFYFDSKKVGEVDFLINNYNDLSVLPIEVKSGKTGYEYRAIPKLVKKEGKYKLSKGYIFDNSNIIKQEGDLYFYPIYMVMFL